MKPHPTIIDVARQAGVSKSTVSRVITHGDGSVSEATRQKVEQAIGALGYEHNAVASSMRTAQTYTVMLAIPDINNPFWPEVARGLQDVMDREGYAVVLTNSDWDGAREQKFLRMARRNRLDGILVNPIRITEAEILETRIPAVILGLRQGFPNLDMVGSDSFGATQKALEYLARLGHSRIGLLLGQSVNSTTHSRLDSYFEFYQKNGLQFAENLVQHVSFDYAGGISGMKRLLEQDPLPTAVLASNDLMAIGALHAASELGYRVPEHISIMGIDDIYVSSLVIPSLTTMRKQKYELGIQAARLLLDRIQGVQLAKPREVKIPCQLVVRASTGPVSSQGKR